VGVRQPKTIAAAIASGYSRFIGGFLAVVKKGKWSIPIAR
jgi:hypothetical protein